MTLSLTTRTALRTAAWVADYTDRDEAVEIALAADLLTVDLLRAGVAYVWSLWNGGEPDTAVLPADAAARYVAAELAYRATL